MKPTGTLTRRGLLHALAAGASWPLLKQGALAQAMDRNGLGAAFRDRFLLGAAVGSATLDREIRPQLDLLAQEFTSVTPENCMKWQSIRPALDRWNFGTADRLLAFAARHAMHVVGHTLVWHSQVPRHVFQDPAGNGLGADQLLARMEEHIGTLVGRYQGRIAAWDVVNEAIDEGNGWRRSPWFNILGSGFMAQAFRFAHAADPAARLLYNDYNMHNPRKREFLLDVLRGYLDQGVPIHGIGLQGHLGLDQPDLEEWERSIAAYAALGLEVHVTELDIDVLPSPYQMSAEISNRFDYSESSDPFRDGLPAAVEAQLADRYEQVFRLLLKYRQVKRVTLWGLHDGLSWKNDFPIRGRTNHPLLFDRSLQPKAAYRRLQALAENL